MRSNFGATNSKEKRSLSAMGNHGSQVDLEVAYAKTIADRELLGRAREALNLGRVDLSLIIIPQLRREKLDAFCGLFGQEWVVEDNSLPRDNGTELLRVKFTPVGGKTQLQAFLANFGQKDKTVNISQPRVVVHSRASAQSQVA